MYKTTKQGIPNQKDPNPKIADARIGWHGKALKLTRKEFPWIFWTPNQNFSLPSHQVEQGFSFV